MNKKIDYAIGVILLAGVIMVILGCILTIGTLIGANQWNFALHEWYEIQRRWTPGISLVVYFWLYTFFVGIIISMAANCISLVRIFKKRSVDKKIDYVIGLLLLAGAPLVILGYYLFIDALIVNNQMNHILNEGNELLIALGSGGVAMLYFWIYTFVIGIIISMAANCIALVRIVLEKES